MVLRLLSSHFTSDISSVFPGKNNNMSSVVTESFRFGSISYSANKGITNTCFIMCWASNQPTLRRIIMCLDQTHLNIRKGRDPQILLKFSILNFLTQTITLVNHSSVQICINLQSRKVTFIGYDVNAWVWSWSDFRFWIISNNYIHSVLTFVVKIFTYSNWKFNKCWLILARQLLCKKYQRTSCKRRLTHFKRELVAVVGWLCLKHTATVVWLSGDSCLAWHTRAELQQRHQNGPSQVITLQDTTKKPSKKPPELECL